MPVPPPQVKPMPEPGELRERALRLLARREHSRTELSRKLAAAGFERDAIDPMLDAFEAKNWLSDQRFAESYIADHRARAGSIKLGYDLRQRGVPEGIIDELLSANQDSELERARAVWQKKFNCPPTDVSEKSRHIRFLQSRGFTLETIRQTIGECLEKREK